MWPRARAGALARAGACAHVAEPVLRKLLATAIIAAAFFVLRWAFAALEDRLHRRASSRSVWAQKIVRLALGAVTVVAIANLSFEEPARILDGFRARGVEVASATYEIVGLPKIALEVPEELVTEDRGPQLDA